MMDRADAETSPSRSPASRKRRRMSGTPGGPRPSVRTRETRRSRFRCTRSSVDASRVEEDPQDPEHVGVGGPEERLIVALRVAGAIPERELGSPEVERLGVHEDPVHIEQNRVDRAHRIRASDSSVEEPLASVTIAHWRPVP